MASNVVATKANFIALEKNVRVLLEKAAHAADKAEQFYVSAGLRLKQLKETHATIKGQRGWKPWAEYVRATFDLGQPRADELIRIADGRTTVAETRGKTAERMKKLRKPMSRDIGSAESEDEEILLVEGRTPKPKDGFYNSSSQDERKEFFLFSVNKIIDDAEYFGVPDEEVCAAAHRVAKAWTTFAKELEKRK
jgi:hypothetical protein